MFSRKLLLVVCALDVVGLGGRGGKGGVARVVLLGGFLDDVGRDGMENEERRVDTMVRLMVEFKPEKSEGLNKTARGFCNGFFNRLSGPRF